MTDSTPSARSGEDRSPHSAENPQEGEQRTLRLVSTVGNTVEAIERFYDGSPPTPVRHLCDDLREFARELSRTHERPQPDLRPVEDGQHYFRPITSPENINRQTATHAVPTGSGGLGPLMTMSPEEKRNIDWGDKVTEPSGKSKTG